MNQNTSDTRERLLDAAQDLIQRRGLNAMSFQDLSDAVGIRKASVHHHFSCKADMVSALLQRFQLDFDESVAGVMGARCSGRTRLKRYFSLFQQTLAEGPHDRYCLCGMLAAEMLSLEADGLQLVRRFLRSSLDSIRSIISEGVADGSLNERAGAKGTAELVLSTLEGGLLLARCEGRPQQFADVSGRLLALLSAD